MSNIVYRLNFLQSFKGRKEHITYEGVFHEKVPKYINKTPKMNFTKLETLEPKRKL